MASEAEPPSGDGGPGGGSVNGGSIWKNPAWLGAMAAIITAIGGMAVIARDVLQDDDAPTVEAAAPHDDTGDQSATSAVSVVGAANGEVPQVAIVETHVRQTEGLAEMVGEIQGIEDPSRYEVIAMVDVDGDNADWSATSVALDASGGWFVTFDVGLPIADGCCVFKAVATLKPPVVLPTTTGLSLPLTGPQNVPLNELLANLDGDLGLSADCEESPTPECFPIVSETVQASPGSG